MIEDNIKIIVLDIWSKMRPPSQAWCYRNLKWQNEASVLWFFCTINFKFLNREEDWKYLKINFMGKLLKYLTEE